MSSGPFQAPVYQASMRWPDGPCQKTSWVLPSLLTATPGVEERVPSWGKPTGPFHWPVYQASASWLVVVLFQNTSCVEPSGVRATCGAPTPCGEKDGGGGAVVTAMAPLVPVTVEAAMSVAVTVWAPVVRRMTTNWCTPASATWKV